MENFTKTVEIRWSDLDPNFHVLHSKYYDFGAYCRMAFLVENGLTAAVMFANQIGPILFREECIFKKEILFGDVITIDVQVQQLHADFSKWTMRHHLFKNKETLAAVITADGAWIDTAKRKLTTPPQIVKDMFEKMPKTATFTLIN